MKIGYLLYDPEYYPCGINRVISSFMLELMNASILETEIIGYNYIEKLNIPYIPALYSNSDYNNREKELNVLFAKTTHDIVHSFYYPLPNIGKCKKIITIHDLIVLREPRWFSNSDKKIKFYNENLREGVQNADLILSVSEYTKTDIIDIYNVNKDKIRVIYPGVFEEVTSVSGEDESCEMLLPIKKPYILSLCTLEPRKNLESLVIAYEQMRLHDSSLDIQLVLVGRIGWLNAPLFNRIASSVFAKDIIVTNYVSDKVLKKLYKEAVMFAYVSLYEGFGLPILEAMAKGKAVLTSSVSSMPEVGGDAVCYCNPNDIDSIEQGLTKVLYDTEYRLQLEKCASVRASTFSYKRMVKETLDSYKDVMELGL